MKNHIVGLSLVMLLALSARSSALDPATGETPSGHQSHVLNVKYPDMKWTPMVPELGERSSEICILHSDSTTGATQLMIRVPANFHVPKHWHTANETHTVVSGTFVMECEGKREALGAGSFNYIPGRMHHEAWTTPEEGALLFITVDKAWDINWVNGAPKPADFIGGASVK